MKRTELSILLTLTAAVFGCSSNNNDSFEPVSGSNKLKPVLDALEFERSYKDTLISYYDNRYDSVYYTDDVLEGDAAQSSTTSSPGSSTDTSSPAVTSTNLQEQGVDEADRIKTDGQFLYVLEAPTYDYYTRQVPNNVSTSQPNNPGLSNLADSVTIYQLNPDEFDLQNIKEIDLELADNTSADGLFLFENEGQKSLVVMGGSNAGGSGWYDSYSWNAGSTSISLLDINDPAETTIVKSINIEGRTLSSRRIGDQLLIASRYHPNIDNIHYYPQTDGERSDNRSIINSLSLYELLPKITDEDGQSMQLTSATDCFVPDAKNSSAVVADVINLYSVNLNDLTISSSLCYVGASEAFYASTDAVYLATTRYQWVMEQADVVTYQGSTVETDLHEFAFQDGQLSYQASGSVDGHLGWNAKQRPFRLSAKNGDLRVVSYTAELTDDKSPVKLSVLRKNGSDLMLLATLPSDAHPEPLGKPGESLYASRFVGDKAYFVTFRTTDPLYVIDLSTPTEPKLLAELYVEGYSDYLHPVGENLLLGIGKDAIADPAGGDGRGAWYQGVKLSLIDVEDPENPLEVDKLVFGQRGTESTALSDHHAFTYLSADQTGSMGRLAFPLQLNKGMSEDAASTPWNWHDWQATGLQLVSVNESNKTLFKQGFIEIATPSDAQYAPSISHDRALLFDDAVYFVQENDVYGTAWDSQELTNGPR